jgi:RNA 3'-terminal phosphate cyclase (ATP)
VTGLVSLDGAGGEGGGQILRTAVSLAAATGQGFQITRIRANRPQPGLRPQHLAAVRAGAMACNARLSGAFDGSPDLRFEPGALAAGEYSFEIATAGSTSLLLQTVLLPLALAGGRSRVEATGGTHVPNSPSFHYLERHWLAVVARLGVTVQMELGRAGFYPPGGGLVRALVHPWTVPATLSLETRGELLELRGISGAGRLKGDVAKRQADAAREQLWESRRLQSTWEIVELPATSPGSFLMLEAVFANGRAALTALGERRVRAEALGERVARQALKFIEEQDGAVDPHLADQLVLPLALARGGGRVSTTEVTAHLLTVVDVLNLFGIAARTWGRLGGPGGFEVPAL